MGRVALLFRFDEIRVSTSLIRDIGFPRHIHIYVDRSRLRIYIRACRKDPDAFSVNRKAVLNTSTGYSLHSPKIMNMLFDLLSLEDRQLCIRCSHKQVDSKTLEVELENYTVTDRPKKKEKTEVKADE